MPIKGELLLEYNEESVYEQEKEYVKENWGEQFAGDTDIDEPTDEDIDKIVFNRLSDGMPYQFEWDEFKENLSYLLKERNPSDLWESLDFPDENREKEERKFFAENGNDLLNKLIDFDRGNNITRVSIFAFGKDGICIDPEWHSEKCLLAACKEGFYRDWDRDGICIMSPGEAE
jgi:hypothetical protein